MKHIILFLFLFTIVISWGQENNIDKTNQKKHVLKGIIIDGKTKEIISNAHIINLNRTTGSVSDSKGLFRIHVSVSDTVYFSFLGYQSIKLKISNDLIKGNDLEIAMFELPIDIEEVIVKPYQLIGVLEVDAKNVPINKFARIHINGLPQTYEVGSPTQKSFANPINVIFHPVDFVYNLFGKKPKQLRKLKKLRRDKKLREMLEEKTNREVLMEYLEMDKPQLNVLLDHCNYTDYFIKKATDLQVIEAVLECYENYKALKKGSTIKKRKEK